MAPRKTRKPVSNHLNPSPATPAQQATTQSFNVALDEVLLSSPPQHQPPPASGDTSDSADEESAHDTDGIDDSAEGKSATILLGKIILYTAYIYPREKDTNKALCCALCCLRDVSGFI